MKETIAYKIVSENNKSFCLNNIPRDWKTNKYILDYKLGETTKKKRDTIGIMCFSSINDAIEFAEKFCYNYKIYKITGHKTKKQNSLINIYLNEASLKYFYKNKNNYCHILAPRGTIFFSSVKPIELIKEYKYREK